MTVTSFQHLKFRGTQISWTFSYFLHGNALFYHFLANSLVHNKKMSENTSQHVTSQTFTDSIEF